MGMVNGYWVERIGVPESGALENGEIEGTELLVGDERVWDRKRLMEGRV